MRQLFRTQYKLRSNPILLNYQNTFHQFSFLETDFDRINTTKLIGSKKVGEFVEKIRKNKGALNEVQSYDFKEEDLRRL